MKATLKKSITFKSLIIALVLCLPFVANAQMCDLLKMSQGKLVLSRILYDSNDNLFGYFYLYELDAADKEKQNMEYVLLDKNLNKVNNGEFVIPKFKSFVNTSSFADCDLMDDKLVLTRNYGYFKMSQNPYYDTPTFLMSSFMFISLKDKSVSEEFTYKDGQMSKVQDVSQIKSDNKKIVVKNVIHSYSNEQQSGFYLTNHSDSKDYMEKEITFFDKEGKLRWKYEYNTNASSNDYWLFSFISLKGNNLYLSETRLVNREFNSYRIVKLDFQTGKKLYVYDMENPQSKYIHRVNAKEINGNLCLTGDYIANPGSEGLSFRSKKILGLYRIVLDGAGKEIANKHLPWSELSAFCSLTKKGCDKDGFFLRGCKYMMFADGTVSILTDRFLPYKDGINVVIPPISWVVYYATKKFSRTGDFVLLHFDKEFNPIQADTIQKEPSVLRDSYYDKSSDYLFSNYIHNDSAVVFFYENHFKSSKTRNDSIVLGINVLDKQKRTEEKIPIYAPNKYFIEVMPAKEGYIMLREYNKDEKHNQIRLEKLNY